MKWYTIFYYASIVIGVIGMIYFGWRYFKKKKNKRPN